MAALLLPALVLLLLVALALSSPSAVGGPTPGKACKPVGRTVVVGEWTYTCVKKKKGKSPVWVRTPTPAPTPTPTPTPEPPANDEEIASLAFARTTGAERPGDPTSTGTGPWATTMRLSEGATLGALGTPVDVIDQAGVPSLLALPDGRLLAYFVSWAQGNVMAVGVLDAGTWRFYRIAVSGFAISPGGANGVDPSAVTLPDGSIRLFWMQPTGPRGTSQIHSATSAPGSALGVRFAIDAGTRLDPGTMVFDPTVALCAGQWYLWVNESGVTTFATSTDGLSFTEQSAPAGLDGVFPWSATCLPDGNVQLLASKDTASGLPYIGDMSGFRANGSSLLPSGALADASLAQLPDGSWTLAYLTRMP